METRDYVRIIQRNVDIYRALYGGEASDRAEATRPLASPEGVSGRQDQQM